MLDLTLTFVLLAPIIASGVLWAIGVCTTPSVTSRRLSDADVRRIYRITAARAGKFQSN